MTKLRCIEPGTWRSEDGRVEITLDETYETECDAPHPVRMKLSKLTPEQVKRLPFGHALKGGYATWLCPGGEIHYYSMWTAMVDGEWTRDSYDTFAAARGAVEELVGPTTLARRVKTAEELMVEDEMRGLREFLASAARTARGPWGPYLDRKLVERNERRLEELESRHAVR